MVLPETIKFLRLKTIPYSGIFSQMLFHLSFSSLLCSLTVSTPQGKDFFPTASPQPLGNWGWARPALPVLLPANPVPSLAGLSFAIQTSCGGWTCPHKPLCLQPHSPVPPSLAARSPRSPPAPAAHCVEGHVLFGRNEQTHTVLPHEYSKEIITTAFAQIDPA